MELNEYQSVIDLSQYPEEVVEQFEDCINNIPYIKNLISKDRQRAKDRPRDEKGRIIVDITNPHILEDMDYFRQPALHFEKHKCYTFLRPSANPQSEYYKYWKEEIRRCREGYIRESDGEWVTGYCYWFMNYNPMMVNKVIKGSKRAIRTEAFPYMWEGIYLRFHYIQQAREAGLNWIELAKRGCGKSYLLSSIMTHNMFLGENAESNKRIITVLAAAHKDFLSDSKDGTLSKFRPAINFIISNTPFPNLFLKNSPNEMVWQMGYKNANGVESGSMNTVMAISLKDDSEKLRGKRGFILYEEMGSMPNLLSAYDIAQRSVYDGDFAFGQQGMVGTAAESESDFSSAKTLLYAPRSYKIKDNPNVYDRVGQGKEHFGYFYPAYLNRAGCYNEDGVSDVTKALMEVLMNRYEAKYGANTKSVLRIIAEDPITPAEAIIKVKAAFFPVQDCNSRLTMLEDEHEFDDVAVGVIELKGDQATFRPTSDIPIHTFPVSNDTPGAIEFYQMPELDKRTSRPYGNRYIIGVDPVDNDSAESSSLYSTFVFDLWTDNIVAEFTGRKQFADDNFEITRRMALFYNAMVIYEANKKGIFAYFQKMNSTHLLAETPQYLRDRGMVKYTAFGSNAYGVNANAIINNYANQLIRDWLLKPYEDIVEGEVITRPNVYRIKAKALLEELVAFTPEINVDRIRALGMVMLLREQELINCGGDINMIKTGNRHENYLGDDPFFKLPSKINTNY